MVPLSTIVFKNRISFTTDNSKDEMESLHSCTASIATGSGVF